MANLFDNFYKKYKFAQYQSRGQNLEAEYIQDKQTDNDIKSLGDFETISYYSAGARTMIKFFSTGAMIMKYQSLVSYKRLFYEEAKLIPNQEVREGFIATASEPRDITAFTAQHSIDHEFTSSWSEGVALAEDIAGDMRALDSEINGDAADDQLSNMLSANAMLKQQANIGTPDDAELTSVESYFIFPEFHSLWLDRSAVILENLDLKKKKSGEERKEERVAQLKQVVDRILQKIESAKKVVKIAYDEQEGYLAKLRMLKKANKYNKNIKKESKNIKTINKKTNIRMADKSINSYYKDALKGSGNDPLMKQFYSGMKDFYEDKAPLNDSRKSKDLMDFFLEESDITSSSHSEDVVLSKSLGEGGLVENGHQSKQKHVDVAGRLPSGNFKNK